MGPHPPPAGAGRPARGLCTLFSVRLMGGAPALSELRHTGQVSRTLRLVLSTGCTEGGGLASGARAHGTCLGPPGTWPSAQCHLGGRVGASSLGTSKHHSRKREAGLETSLGTAFALGIPVHPSFQGRKDLGLGGREPRARAHLPGQSLMQQPPAVFKDRAPHTSRLLSVPRPVPPSRPQGPTDGPRAPPGGQSQPDGAAAEGGVTALKVRRPVSNVREQAAPLCSPRPGRDGAPSPAGFPEVSVQMGGAAMITRSEGTALKFGVGGAWI